MGEIENVQAVWISSDDGTYQFESEAADDDDVEVFRLQWSSQGVFSVEAVEKP